MALQSAAPPGPSRGKTWGRLRGCPWRLSSRGFLHVTPFQSVRGKQPGGSASACHKNGCRHSNPPGTKCRSGLAEAPRSDRSAELVRSPQHLHLISCSTTTLESHCQPWYTPKNKRGEFGSTSAAGPEQGLLHVLLGPWPWLPSRIRRVPQWASNVRLHKNLPLPAPARASRQPWYMMEDRNLMNNFQARNISRSHQQTNRGK
mmetsp:Transcript_25646/g.59562  ORF Transcript_25646/g.59562 Transcript_25646/m.59562 type:complete len:203 (-) Transcript_25646:442-1050(-)